MKLLGYYTNYYTFIENVSKSLIYMGFDEPGFLLIRSAEIRICRPHSIIRYFVAEISRIYFRATVRGLVPIKINCLKRATADRFTSPNTLGAENPDQRL